MLRRFTSVVAVAALAAMSVSTEARLGRTAMLPAAPDAYDGLAFEAPDGWSRLRTNTGIVFVPPGEVPPASLTSGLGSVGIYVAGRTPFPIVDDGTPLDRAVLAQLDADRDIPQHGRVERVPAAQAAVEMVGVEALIERGQRRILTYMVRGRRGSVMFSLDYAAVNPFLYDKYLPSFLALVKTVRVE